MKILVISAHPDDETIGAGGTLLRHLDNGDDIYWGIVTQGYPPQWLNATIKKAHEQVLKVGEIMGVKKIYFGKLPTVKLNTISTIEISSILQKWVDETQPDIIYTTSPQDINQDHRIVHDATLIAARPFPGFSTGLILCYEIVTTFRYGYASGCEGFKPNYFVDITNYLDGKLKLMSIYETELKKYPHPRSLKAIECIAKERGISVGLGAAECFSVVRQVII